VTRLHLEASAKTYQAAGGCDDWIDLHLVAEDQRTVTGKVRLISDKGISVISDIDDTIKVSHIGDTRQMLRTAFLEAYRPVRGMNKLYRKWELQGAQFHYLSNSPWHLYPVLSKFADNAHFPPGIYHLMEYRLTDKSLANLFRSAHDKKFPLLEELLTDFPQRRFILVGDSGEEDPEVFGDLARAFPEQILAIFIRAVAGSDLSEQRWEAAFRKLDKKRWRLFRHPKELPSHVGPREKYNKPTCLPFYPNSALPCL
jgi:phosphatidate phosphatase APP1